MKSDLDALMRERGFDAMLVLGASANNPAMYYFTGGGHVTSAVLIKKTGQPPVLYCNAMEREEAERSGLETVPLRNWPLEALAEKPLAIFEQQGFTEGRVGVFGNTDTSVFMHIEERIRDQVPGIVLVGAKPDDSMLLHAMETKDESEVARIRRVGAATVEVVRLVAEFLTSRAVRDDEVLLGETGSPLTVGDVKHKIGLWLAERGVVDVGGCIFSIGRDAAVPHSVGQPGDLIRLGQTIIFDIFPAEAGGGYFYDFTRTWSLGYADPEAEKLHQQVKRAYDSVVANLDLNVPFREYNKLVCDQFHADGHNTPIHTEGVLTTGYVHSLGHGVGLNIHERPFSEPATPDDHRIKPGVVFTIEPGLYYPERGMGVRIEDTYWVGPNGQIELLAEYPYDFMLEMKTWTKPAPRP
jgi:Xaa-Pro aminopeptidase